MKIDAILVQEDTLNEKMITPDKTVVVIDVLRVSSTIITALANGADKIFPVLEVREVFEKKEQLLSEGVPPQKILLGGERMGLKVDGFDLGNSPLEYTPEKVNGKTIIISSTNGTKSITRCKNAGEILIGSFLNAKAVAKYLSGNETKMVFYLSGKEGRFSLEDALGAGMIMEHLEGNFNVEISDAAQMCHTIYESFHNNPFLIFFYGEHGIYLDSIGLKDDLQYCANVNTIDKIPVVCGDGYIRLK